MPKVLLNNNKPNQTL